MTWPGWLSLDRLPPRYRHAVIAAGSGFTGSLLATVGHTLTTCGVTVACVQGMAWRDVLGGAAGVGVTAALAALGLLQVTPLTRQYGVGSPYVPPGRVDHP